MTNIVGKGLKWDIVLANCGKNCESNLGGASEGHFQEVININLSFIESASGKFDMSCRHSEKFQVMNPSCIILKRSYIRAQNY